MQHLYLIIRLAKILQIINQIKHYLLTCE